MSFQGYFFYDLTRFSLKIVGRSNARLPQERRGSKIFPEERSGKKYVQKTVR